MREIALTQGKVALVDDEDFVRVASFKWHAKRGMTGVWYAVRTIPSSTTKSGHTEQLLHRFLLDVPGGVGIDHENRNGLDNQRHNLRIASKAQNAANRLPQRNSLSGFKGVTWDTADAKWRARIHIRGKSVSLGRFPTPEAAARAYDRAAREEWGEFARTNESLGLLASSPV
jgi:hypothetical protein